MARIGGREFAAIAGAILAARLQRVPVVLDGFVVAAAAAILHRMNPEALDHCIAGHVSAEPGHRALLARLGKQPILDLGMRLGEGTGAALAVQQGDVAQLERRHPSGGLCRKTANAHRNPKRLPGQALQCGTEVGDSRHNPKMQHPPGHAQQQTQ
eukprot:gene22707-43058_t